MKEFAVVALMTMIIVTAFAIGGFMLSGCADPRPGDFAPDQVRWIDRNIK